MLAHVLMQVTDLGFLRSDHDDRKMKDKGRPFVAIEGGSLMTVKETVLILDASGMMSYPVRLSNWVRVPPHPMNRQ